jgi:hypothetical protein
LAARGDDVIGNGRRLDLTYLQAGLAQRMDTELVPAPLQPEAWLYQKWMASPYFSHGQLLFDEGEVDRRKTIRTVAPKALIAIWF